MHLAIASPLEAWGSFYVIVGSSAGAMTGLQFVVITLIAQSGPARNRGESVAAFGTPNVVHFCAALLVSAILSVPWSALRQAGLAVAVCGALGVIYSAIVTRRAHRQRDYQPVFEDWLWHSMLPVVTYSALFAAGAVLGPDSSDALFAVGAAVLLLVFIGIHNAWDTVTFVTVGPGAEAVRAGAEAPRGSTPGPSPAAGPVTGEAPASPTPGAGTNPGALSG